MDKIELYYDHYKETFELSKQAQHRRNCLFVWLCVLEALSFLFLIKPDKAVEVFAAGINAHFETNLVFGNVVLQTLLWILIAYIIGAEWVNSFNLDDIKDALDRLAK